MTFNLTLKALLARGSLNPAAPAALHLWTRRSVTPLSQTAFVRQSNLLLKPNAEASSLMAGLMLVKPAARK